MPHSVDIRDLPEDLQRIVREACARGAVERIHADGVAVAQIVPDPWRRTDWIVELVRQSDRVDADEAAHALRSPPGDGSRQAP
jgi:antitoxin (DNA-binding transcriptional repressor) of toxin-antitoxin stability system